MRTIKCKDLKICDIIVEHILDHTYYMLVLSITQGNLSDSINTRALEQSVEDDFKECKMPLMKKDCWSNLAEIEIV